MPKFQAVSTPVNNLQPCSPQRGISVMWGHVCSCLFYPLRMSFCKNLGTLVAERPFHLDCPKQLNGGWLLHRLLIPPPPCGCCIPPTFSQNIFGSIASAAAGCSCFEMLIDGGSLFTLMLKNAILQRVLFVVRGVSGEENTSSTSRDAHVLSVVRAGSKRVRSAVL